MRFRVAFIAIIVSLATTLSAFGQRAAFDSSRQWVNLQSGSSYNSGDTLQCETTFDLDTFGADGIEFSELCTSGKMASESLWGHLRIPRNFLWPMSQRKKLREVHSSLP